VFDTKYENLFTPVPLGSASGSSSPAASTPSASTTY